ncbi:UNVERIFIED_CONTAM: hypothetical protein Sradi_6534200 [Sesamum radiatum]|uniref:SWIM-type domain-containing protein n=1 Tax=Sesamum radiatum TaxID=300843 RepID=A0AAW2JVT9_SESRA
MSLRPSLLIELENPKYDVVFDSIGTQIGSSNPIAEGSKLPIETNEEENGTGDSESETDNFEDTGVGDAQGDNEGSGDGNDFVDDDDDDLINSGDDFESDVGSDEEGKDRFPVFRSSNIMDPTFELGMVFNNKKEFIEAIHSHAIKTKRNLKIVKNDLRRVYAKCAEEECKWRINALKLGKEESFQIREYKFEHKCGRAFKVKNCTSRWLSKRFEDKFRTDPKRNVKGFRHEVCKDLRLSISKQQAYKARRKALQKIQGDDDEQYNKLWDYVEELRRTNPGSTVLMSMVDSSDGRGGSDKRFCVRHLHGNFKTAGFRGQAFKLALWNAARATTVQEWEWRMQEMALLSQQAYDWFSDKPPTQWSRAYFNTFPKCDMLLNNICETFNYCILDARERPVLTMLEWIREFLMTRLQENRDRALKKWKGKICPKIKKIVEKNMDKASDCIPIKSDDNNYEIACYDGSRYTVNLQNHTCSCRKWDLSGIPCNHGMSAIACQHINPEDFVDTFYTVETFNKVYSYAIAPINGPQLWAKTGYVPPAPPNYGRSVGRPAKARRLERDEPANKKKKGVRGQNKQTRLKRLHYMVKCSFCGGSGHNKKSCELKKEAEDFVTSLDAENETQIENVEEENIQGPSKLTGRKRTLTTENVEEENIEGGIKLTARKRTSTAASESIQVTNTISGKAQQKKKAKNV